MKLGTSVWMPRSGNVVEYSGLKWPRGIDCPAMGVCINVKLEGTSVRVVAEGGPLVVLEVTAIREQMAVSVMTMVEHGVHRRRETVVLIGQSRHTVRIDVAATTTAAATTTTRAAAAVVIMVIMVVMVIVMVMAVLVWVKLTVGMMMMRTVEMT